MSILNTVVEETTKTDLTKSTKKVRIVKPKSHKCNRCGRWISSPVQVGGQVYGSGCAKKARINKALSESGQLDLIQEIEKAGLSTDSQLNSLALIVPEAIIKSLPLAVTITTSIQTVELKQVGEIWLHNKVSGQCLDCDTHKPIFYKFALSTGKVLSCSCESCFEKNNYFNVA